MNTITKYQTQYEVIERSQIKNAPYNPRKISAEALKRIKANIKQRGLMGGIVFNKRTSNLVSGHQRLSCVDSLEKSESYLIRVEVVDLSEKEEKEQNIFLNSATVQGEFDLDLLGEVIPDIDYKAAGLDETDLHIICVDNLIQSDEPDEVTEEITEISEALKNETKENRKRYNAINDIEPIVTLSFDTYENKCSFMEKIGLPDEDRFIKGEIFLKKIKVISKF